MSDYPVGMMSKDDRVLHLPGPQHGMARCGQNMGDDWLVGPFAFIAEKSSDACERCFDG
jgi:hypothetical protein